MKDLTQKQMFDRLSALAKNYSAFLRVEQQYNGKDYTIFVYRLASHSDFMVDEVAFESRGITFRHIDGYPYIVSRPFEKFFNLGETDRTQHHALSFNDNTESIMDKHDGSMITTVEQRGIRDDIPVVKTKGSFHTIQARMARAFLMQPEHGAFAKELAQITEGGLTVIMEYVAPENRIVLKYDEEDLIVLAVRDNISGEYVPLSNLRKHGYEEVYQRSVQEYAQSLGFHSVDAFVREIPQMRGIEGFVFRMKDGLQVKVKTKEYSTLHYNKDNVYNPNALFVAVMEEQTDDLRALFASADDKESVDRINRFEDMVLGNLRAIIDKVEGFVAEHGHLDRKEFANKAKEEFDSPTMFLVMHEYEGRKPDYIKFARWGDNHKKFLIDKEWHYAPQFDPDKE